MINFTIEQKNKIIKAYHNNLTLLNMSKMFNTSVTPIKRILRDNNLTTRITRKYNFNENIFDDIDTKGKSYWLGFLTADGNVYKNSLRLELNNKDYDHLLKFKTFMQSDHRIYAQKKNCHLFTINGRDFINTIQKHNLIPNKSSITFTPNTIPKYLLSHFYRGIFDGDGWVTSRKQARQKNNKRYYIDKRTYEFGFCSGSEKFIHQIHQWICHQLDDKRGYIIHRNQHGNSCYQLTFGGNEVFIKISKILYKNTNQSIYLDRKYIKTNDAKCDILKS